MCVLSIRQHYNEAGHRVQPKRRSPTAQTTGKKRLNVRPTPDGLHHLTRCGVTRERNSQRLRRQQWQNPGESRHEIRNHRRQVGQLKLQTSSEQNVRVQCGERGSQLVVSLERGRGAKVVQNRSLLSQPTSPASRAKLALARGGLTAQEVCLIQVDTTHCTRI